MKIDNSFFERLEEFIYLGTTLKNNNSIQEEIKCRMKRECRIFVFLFAIKI